MHRSVKDNVHGNCRTRFDLQGPQNCSNGLVDRGDIREIVPSKFHVAASTTLTEHESEEVGKVLGSLNQSDSRTYRYETYIKRHTEFNRDVDGHIHSVNQAHEF